MARTKNPPANTSKSTPRRKTAATRTKPAQNTARVVTKAARDIPTQGPAEQQIRERAYYIYLERQDGTGDALGDWLQAERELGRAPEAARG